MVEENLVNVVELSEPISAEKPIGLDLRLDTAPDSIYYKLREARSSARAIERSNTGKKADDLAPNPHWATIIKLAPKALQQSKDLEIAAWYVEALLREHNFTGLSAGLELIHNLISNFGETLYPSADEEDGIETTLAPLTGLNGVSSAAGTLVAPINCVFITKNTNGENYATWQYTQSANLARAPNEQVRNERIKSGVPKMEALIAAAKNSGKDFYEQLMQDLDTATQNYDKLVTLLAEKFGDKAPPSSNIRSALSGCRKAIQMIAKDMLQKTVSAEIAEVETISTEVLPSNPVIEVAAAMNTPSTATAKDRAEAVNNLKNLAEFFKQTEPHSPIGFSLDRLVRWSSMSLPELMLELVDNHAQDSFMNKTGVTPPPPPMPAYPAMDQQYHQPQQIQQPMDYGNPAMPPQHNPGYMDYQNNPGMGYPNNPGMGYPNAMPPTPPMGFGQ